MAPQFERLVLDPADPLTQQTVGLIRSSLFGLSTPDSWETAVASLASFDTRHYVLTDADNNGRLLAVGSLMPSDTSEDESYVNELVAAVPGRGLGRMMLANLEIVACNGFGSSVLALEPADSSRRFYARQGYKQHPVVSTDLMKRL